MNLQSKTNEPQVFIIDDDQSVLTALKRLLNSFGYGVQTFTSPLAFLACYNANVSGCVLLDIGMDELGGLELQERLAKAQIPMPIIFVTGCDDVGVSVQAMKAGAIDYLSKPIPEGALLAAIGKALEHDKRARQLRQDLSELRLKYATLTRRERQVMAELLRGRLNKQIAFDLSVVEKTVKVHRARVLGKMKVRSIAALTHAAELLGLYEQQ